MEGHVQTQSFSSYEEYGERKIESRKLHMLSNIHSGKLNTQLLSCQAPVSQNSRKYLGPEKPFVKLPPAYSVKLEFLYVTKGIKTKITAKFGASRGL